MVPVGGDDSDALILLSGGIDSMVAAHVLQNEGLAVTALFIDYGHPARTEEREASEQVSAVLGCQYNSCSVSRLSRLPWTGEVFFRNAMLLSVAATWSAGRIPIIAIGLHGGSDYPDTQPAFVRSFQDALSFCSGGSVRLLAPLMDWRKSHSVEYAREVGLPLATTYSCERGGPGSCGRCLSCRERKEVGAGS